MLGVVVCGVQAMATAHQSSRQHAAYNPAARHLAQRVQSPHSSNPQVSYPNLSLLHFLSL